MRRLTQNFFTLTSFTLLLGLAGCSDDSGGTGNGTDESGTAGETNADTASEASDTNSTTGDGDGDDEGCAIGVEGCPCTQGGACDPGLMCEGGICVPAAADTGDGDGDSGDGDGDSGDGDGDGDTGDGDGDGDTTGDGDGDTGGGLCEPNNMDDPCTACAKDGCCMELEECVADDVCACVIDCQPGDFQCIQGCGGFNNPATQSFFGCLMQSCGNECGF